MIDRVTQPAFKQVDKINFTEPVSHTLNNGIKVYTINAGEQEVAEIDFLFDAGSWYQDKKLIASFTNQMITEGTSNKKSHDIHEKLDFFGAFLGQNSDAHQAEISLFTPNKYLKETLSIVEDIIKNASFPEQEFEVLKQSNKQNFLVENEKTAKMASRKFAEVVFGSQHPYGKRAVLDDYDQINTDDLKQFHKQYYSADRMTIIAAGKISEQLIEILNNTFGNIDIEKQENISACKKYHFKSDAQKKHYVVKENAVQSAIRIGYKTINQKHPDFCGLMFLNTLFGGYFGSRLMSNIREDKGYTYGIRSFLVSQQETGYFVITTETGTDVCKAAIKEIYKEMNILRTEKIGNEELELVRNYLLGDLLRGFDGPFKLSEAFKNLLSSNIDYSFYETYIETIKTITADELMALAKQYFVEENMYEIVAGKQ